MPSLMLPLGTEVEYRGMTGKDEDILTNRKKVTSGEAVNEILANCVTKLGDSTVVQVGDIERLKTPDRTALLMAIRRESYGDEMPAELQCESCKTKFNVTVDLSVRPDRPAPAGYSPDTPFEVTLSDGTVVRFDYLDGKKERQLMKTQDNVLTTAMLYRLVEVSGVHKNDLRKWLVNLPVKLRSELRKHMEATECGPDTEVTADCTNCGTEHTFQVQGQPTFFFPER